MRALGATRACRHVRSPFVVLVGMRRRRADRDRRMEVPIRLINWE
ncbi:hypothetical protein SZ55_1848 [Pseudomonas sp. FeS53a]|nr:hypothetical protein SZ55_1848 [Pseudomonas sp. FeS53a]